MSQLIQLPPGRSTFSELLPHRSLQSFIFPHLGEVLVTVRIAGIAGRPPGRLRSYSIEVLPYEVAELLPRFLHFACWCHRRDRRRGGRPRSLWRPGELARPITWRRRLDGVARRRRGTSILVAAGRHLVVWCFWCCCALVFEALRWTRCGVCDVGAALRGRGAIDFSPAHSGTSRAPSLPAHAWPVWPATWIRSGPVVMLRSVGKLGASAGNTRTLSKICRKTPATRAHRCQPHNSRTHACKAVIFTRSLWLQLAAGNRKTAAHSTA